MLVETTGGGFLTPAELEELESQALQQTQVECPVIHRFGPGVYLREVAIPAGTFAMGHYQRHEHLNIMLCGEMAMLGEDGRVNILQAPLVTVGKPGRKIAVAITDCVWLNVYPNFDEARDIDALEDRWLDKSEMWKAHSAADRAAEEERRAADRDDFHSGGCQFLSSTTEAVDLPPGFDNITVRSSAIHGKGLFTTTPINAGELVGPVRLNGRVTKIWRYLNHSRDPNTVLTKVGDNFYAYSVRRIRGCAGGDQGEEITVNYRQIATLFGEV